jgi:hypothetical protein
MRPGTARKVLYFQLLADKAAQPDLSHSTLSTPIARSTSNSSSSLICKQKGQPEELGLFAARSPVFLRSDQAGRFDAGPGTRMAITRPEQLAALRPVVRTSPAFRPLSGSRE